jgi:hypothetical protein
MVAVLSLVVLFSTVGGHFASASRPSQVTTSTIESLAPLQQLFNGPFTVLSTTGTNMLCEFWSLNFTATVGQYLTGSFNSDIPVSFYVVRTMAYQDWLRAGTCGSMTDAIAGSLLTTSYGFTPVAIPDSGAWTIVIVNSSNARNADGYLAVYLSSVPLTVTQPLTGTITMTYTSTTASVVSGQPVPGFPVSSILLGIMAGLAATIIFRRRKRL